MAGEGVRGYGHRNQYAQGIAKCRLDNGGSVVFAVPGWRQRELSFLTVKDVWM